ncbi:MAG: dihydroorotate dehydrogenase [Dehalococcoidia bacterium]|nr:dihydroorotate dehydrogenase [Dehalococcoidia bacterium]
MDLSVQLAPHNRRGLLLENPVMTASGTYGYGTELGEVEAIQRLGAIVCKGITLHPREGNPQPRLVETASGLLNSIGLQNIGVDALIKDKAPVWAKWKVPVIVNIAGETVKEYGEIARKLDGVKGVAAIEVNISCPNIAAGGLEFGTDAELALRVTSTVRTATKLPLIVKLSPNVTDMVPIARAVVDAGADALTVMNTIRGMAIDVNTGKPILGNTFGGLSGPAVKPVALYWVYRVSTAVTVPVIGCGGIMTAADAVEFLMAGASAVQVGTANFVNPRAPLEVLDGLEAILKAKGVTRLSDIIGIAKE